MTEALLTTATNTLYSIKAEPSKLLRKARLKAYVNSKPPEHMVVSLILSFQLAGMLEAYQPKFNTIPFIDFKQHFGEFFYEQTKERFISLPYLVQKVLYLMSSPEALSLNASITSDMNITYIHPYTWCLDNIEVRNKKAVVCPFCGIDNDTSKLCDKCHTELKGFAEYRCKSFVLTLSPKNSQPVPKVNYGNFSFRHNNFEVTRRNINEIEYNIIDSLDEPLQLVLPFEEYQKEI